jgi:hypothetical protein
LPRLIVPFGSNSSIFTPFNVGRFAVLWGEVAYPDLDLPSLQTYILKGEVMALIISEDEQKAKLIDIEQTILESFVALSNVSMAMPHIFQFVKRKHPYVTPHQVRKALTHLEEKHILAPATYSLHSRIYPVSDFIRECTLGHFIDDDGSGYLLTEDFEQGERIFPSDIYKGWIPPGKFIIWYNR